MILFNPSSGNNPQPSAPSYTNTYVTYDQRISDSPPWSQEIQGEIPNSQNPIPNVEYIKTIDFGTGVTCIDQNAFSNSHLIQSVTFRGNTHIKSYAFFSDYLDNITFEDNAYVDSLAFQSSNNSIQITIKNSIPTFADYSLANLVDCSEISLVFQNKTRDEVIAAINNYSINKLMFGDANITFNVICSDKQFRVNIDESYEWRINFYTDWECTVTPSGYGEVLNSSWEIYDSESYVLRCTVQDLYGGHVQDFELYGTENTTELTAEFRCDIPDCPAYVNPLLFTFTRSEL